MFSTKTRRGRIRIITFVLAAIFALGGSALYEHHQRARLQQAVTNSYLHAFSEVTASMERMDNALHKGVYVTSAPMLCSLCDEVYAQSQSAQMALGQLPFGNVELEQTASFVSTVGDYASALSRSAARDGKCPEGADQQNWLALAKASQQLSARLDELELQLYDGTLTIDNVEQAQQRLSRSQTASGETDHSAFKQVEADFPETPSLIYDGPFSQHLTGKGSIMLEGQRSVSQAEALDLARAATGWSNLGIAYNVDGEIPVYTCTDADGLRTVHITRKGGQMLSCMEQITPASSRLSTEQGIQAAHECLQRLGYEEMAESYHTLYDNILTVNFCYAPEGVRCYPDLVKVSVSMEDGSMVGFEAQGYLTNHHQRRLETPKITQQEAEEKVSPLLRVIGRNLAVIPSRGEYEVLCWEFLCENEEGEHVISYINAETGAEEKILLLLEDEHGTLSV